VAVVQYTFTHKQYTEQHNKTEYPERNIHNNKNTYEILVHKNKEKHIKYTDIYIYIYIYKKLLDDLKDRREYSHFKEEALDRTMWRHRFGGGFGPVVRQITE